jgi:uncharacterized membrane protein
MNKPRILLLYTDDYLTMPFKIVYDGSVTKDKLDKVEAKYEKRSKKATDPHITLVRVSQNLSNEEVLKFYSNSMELCPKYRTKQLDEELKRRLLAKKFIEEYSKTETQFFKDYLKKSL